MSEELSARAYARVGLLGNPGDSYGAFCLAFSVYDFAADVTLRAAPEVVLPEDPDAAQLLRVGLDEFERYRGTPVQPVCVEMQSTVPRQVGLAGSSAIVIALLRALATYHGVTLAPDELAELALAAEVEGLGIVAGPVDRVVQSYEGLLAMDFTPPRNARNYRRLDAKKLPPMFVAWNPERGQASGDAHRRVAARWASGDSRLRSAIAELSEIARRGLRCLEDGDVGGLAACLDANFEVRAAHWPLRARDVELVEIARASGCAAKYCGSGGAVVGIVRDEARFPELETRYVQAGFRICRPAVERPA